MGLGKTAVRLAASIALFFVAIWALPQMAPEVPGSFEGVQDLPPVRPEPAGPAVGSASESPPLPPGFPSMYLPPPKIVVAEGESQPIDTKYGWTYEIPADWQNLGTGITSWFDSEKSVVYSGVGRYRPNHCPESNGSTIAVSGITGRDGMDLHTAALDVARGAEIVFGDPSAEPPRLEYSEPVATEVAGEPAVRYTVTASGIHTLADCDSTEATFDVVSVPGFATATVAVFVVRLEANTATALDHSTVNNLISTLRRTDQRQG